jgi:alpha-2-macroglobulin
VTLPAGALQDLSRLEVSLAPSLAPSLVDGLQYLIDYPYGCVEQTMSRMLPNAAVTQAFGRLGIGNETLQVDLPPVMRLALQRLYAFQHFDGGWGWWYDDATDPYQTAYVLLGLAMTHQAGYEVDSSVLDRGAQALSRMLPGAGAEAQAYGAYALAMAGQPVTLTLPITEAIDLDPFYQAALALALDTAGEGGAVQALLDEIREAAVQDESGIHWPVDASPGRVQLAMGSEVRTTAMVLSALVRLDPSSPLLPGAARWLVGQRQGDGWGDTQKTSFAILALTDYLLVAQEVAAGASYELYVNDQVWAQGQLAQADLEQTWVLTFTQALSRPLLLPGENEIRLELVPDGQATPAQLYYRVVLDALRPVDVRSAAARTGERSIGLERTYRLPGSGAAVNEFQQGDLVEVQLTLDVPAESWYVLVEDRLPAGFEALNERLGTTSHAGSASTRQASTWQQYGYNRKEVHDQTVTFFATHLEPGQHSFTYLARATVAGEFSVLPARAYPMYEPEVWGRSDGTLIRVGLR